MFFYPMTTRLQKWVTEREENSQKTNKYYPQKQLHPQEFQGTRQISLHRIDRNAHLLSDFLVSLSFKNDAPQHTDLLGRKAPEGFVQMAVVLTDIIFRTFFRQGKGTFLQLHDSTLKAAENQWLFFL